MLEIVLEMPIFVLNEALIAGKVKFAYQSVYNFPVAYVEFFERSKNKILVTKLVEFQFNGDTEFVMKTEDKNQRV